MSSCGHAALKAFPLTSRAGFKTNNNNNNHQQAKHSWEGSLLGNLAADGHCSPPLAQGMHSKQGSAVFSCSSWMPPLGARKKAASNLCFHSTSPLPAQQEAHWGSSHFPTLTPFAVLEQIHAMSARLLCIFGGTMQFKAHHQVSSPHHLWARRDFKKRKK